MILIDNTYTAEKIIKNIAQYKYVSFDIFDTLIKRSVLSPEEVFIQVANDYRSQIGGELNPLEFQYDRIEAARTAKRIAEKEGREETTLTEIYNCFPPDYKNICDDLMKLEMEREWKCCWANPVLKKVFDWCVEEEKVIFIISDMYLPKSIVEKILVNCGYKGYEKLYLSSDAGTKKQTGELFRYMINDSGIDAKQLVHIGDSFKIDYVQARKNGIHALKIVRHVKCAEFYEQKNLDRRQKDQYRKYQQVISDLADPDWDPYYRYGFEVIGPVLYGFCIWLHNRATERKIDRLFFLSRDGYLMQQAYQQLYGEEGIPNGYLYVSRKSLSIPQAWMNSNLKSLLEHQIPYRLWGVKEVCEILSIDADMGKSAWQECGISLEERLTKDQLLYDSRISCFFECVKESVIRKSEEEFALVKKYLLQEGVQGKTAIVDIGWTGVIQNYLQQIIKKADISASIYGYYLGLKPITVTGPNAEAFIPKSDYPALYCSQLMEYPFTKTVGSTLSYMRREDATVAPILMPYEFEGKADEQYTRLIQEGAIYFVKQIKTGYGVQPIDYQVAYTNLKNVTKHPRLSDVNLLGNLTHVNYGVVSYLAKTEHVLFYLIHPKRLKSEFKDSGWKIGFMKRLIKLPLPYDRILMLVKCLLGK